VGGGDGGEAEGAAEGSSCWAAATSARHVRSAHCAAGVSSGAAADEAARMRLTSAFARMPAISASARRWSSPADRVLAGGAALSACTMDATALSRSCCVGRPTDPRSPGAARSWAGSSPPMPPAGFSSPFSSATPPAAHVEGGAASSR